jgi:hypothetical protein
MEALTRWLRALIFTPGDSPATGAQEGNPNRALGQVKLSICVVTKPELIEILWR